MSSRAGLWREAGWARLIPVAGPERSFPLIHLILSFSICVFFIPTKPKTLLSLQAYCYHLGILVGPTRGILGFQLFAKVIITYLFNLSNSLNKCDYF
jgi:hypothetical protein